MDGDDDRSLKAVPEITIKLGSQENVTILTLCGARERFANDETIQTLLDDSNYHELPFASYRTFDPQKKKLLGDLKSALPISRMIRRDNTIQRHFVDKMLGKEQTFYRDPRPLAHQFTEMTTDQMTRKMVDLELEERISSFAARPSKYNYDPEAIPLTVLIPQKELLARKTLGEILHGKPPLPEKTSASMRRLSTEQRRQRLMTDAEREVRRHRKGLETYDADQEERIHSSVMEHTRWSAFKNDMRHHRNNTSQGKGKGRENQYTLSTMRYLPKPISMEGDARSLRAASQKVQEIRQSTRFKKKRLDEFEMPGEGPDAREPEDDLGVDDEVRREGKWQVDPNRPVELDGQEFEFSDYFR